jgi:hypothetical protein
VLLAVELCLVFIAAPLAAQGVAIARPVVETLVLAVLAIVVMLSHRRGAIAAILLGLAAVLSSLLFRNGMVAGCRKRAPPRGVMR